MATPVFLSTVVGHGTLDELCPIPDDKIVSTVLVSTATSKQLVFCLPEGHELSDHQTPNIATIHVVDGEATVRVLDQSYELRAGGMVVIPPKVTHSVRANLPTRFLLTLAKEASE